VQVSRSSVLDLTRRTVNCHQCGGSRGRLGRRSSLGSSRSAARDALRVVLVLDLAMVAGHAGHGASEAVATALRVGRAFSSAGSCHQGRECERVASHDESLQNVEENEVRPRGSEQRETEGEAKILKIDLVRSSTYIQVRRGTCWSVTSSLIRSNPHLTVWAML
jgi:hypothetical protein